jgi:hypothetical protein
MPGLVLGGEAPHVLVFLPGFLTPAPAYRELLEPVAESGAAQVRVPMFYRPGLPALLGHPPVREEAGRAAALVERLVAEGREVWLGGHSRGGQAAWLAAGQVAVHGLLLVDPVDGAGPGSRASATSDPAPFTISPLIIGAGMGGRCAPEHLNHGRFAAAAPRRIHLVVPDCGHADMLCGRVGAAGRMLCGSVANPSAARATIAALVVAFMRGDLSAPRTGGVTAGPGTMLDDRWPLPVEWRP